MNDPGIGAPKLKLVACDLDGTLFGADHRPSSRTVAAINALVDRGVVVAAVTGRSWFGGYERAISTGARLDWFLGSNGGHRLNAATGEIEERLVFDAAEVGALLSALEGNYPGLGFRTEHASGIAVSNAYIENEAVDRAYPTTAERTDHDIGKLLINHRTRRARDLLAWVAPHAPPSMNVTTSGYAFVEVTPAGADKGAALDRLCTKLGIDRTEVIAFGDNHNDLTMIEWAGFGVAMANAVPEVQAAADQVTAANTEDGVAVVLEALLASEHGFPRAPG